MIPVLFALVLSMLATGPSFAGTRADVGISITNGQLRDFHLAIEEYFHAPEKEVVAIRERRIPEYDIPVVYYIARHSHVRPETIVAYRLRGHSWNDVTLHFRLTPAIYYVPVKVEVAGSPYGRAYGYYKHRHRNQWRKIVLHDEDVRNLVNLRFLSERYGYPPENVIRLRHAGKNFVVINEDFRNAGSNRHPYGHDVNRDRGHDRRFTK